MINYQLIANSIDFYQKLGYSYLEVPWFVTRQAMEVTSPPYVRYCNSFLGDLVASAEQSFIQLWLEGKLPQGKYVAATPCFRDEPILDEIHLNCFFKVELIEVGFSGTVLEDAKQFFEQFLTVEIVNTNIGKDIVWNNIELGSYGKRTYKDFKWNYGTGCAEPRLSYCIERSKK